MGLGKPDIGEGIDRYDDLEDEERASTKAAKNQ